MDMIRKGVFVVKTYLLALKWTPVVALVAILCSCGGGDKDESTPSLVGSWHLALIRFGQSTVNASDFGISGSATFGEDGTFSMTLTTPDDAGNPESDSVTGTWVLTGSTLTLTGDGDSMSYPCVVSDTTMEMTVFDSEIPTGSGALIFNRF
jgi:hypothetical protein